MENKYKLSDLIGKNYVIECENLEQVKNSLGTLLNIGYKNPYRNSDNELFIHVFDNTVITTPSYKRTGIKNSIPYSSISDFEEETLMANLLEQLNDDSPLKEYTAQELIREIAPALKWRKIDAGNLPEEKVVCPFDGKIIHGYLGKDMEGNVNVEDDHGIIRYVTHYLPESDLLNLEKE